MYKQTLVIAALLGFATAGFNDMTGNWELMQIEGAPEKNATQALGDDKKKEKEGSMSQSSEGSEADEDDSSSGSSSDEDVQLANTSGSGSGDDSSSSDSSSEDVQLGNSSGSGSGDDSSSSDSSSEDIQLNRNLTSSSSDEDANAQLGDDEEEEDHSGEVFNAWDSHDEPKDGEYSRVVPAWFAADGDDLFMRSMIKSYALEGKNKDGSPNGQFWMDEATSRAAASEVLGTHKGIKGAELATYLNTYFKKTWDHFDVNKGGKIEVIKMPQFMRFLASDQSMSLQP